MCVKGIEAASMRCKGFTSELLWTCRSFEAGAGLGLDFMLLLLSIIHIEKDTRGRKKMKVAASENRLAGHEQGSYVECQDGNGPHRTICAGFEGKHEPRGGQM